MDPEDIPLEAEKAVRTLYVVDDDSGMCAVIGGLESTLGCRIETYELGSNFLESPSLNAARGDQEEFCLLLDYKLPDGDGLEVLRQLNERALTVPTVLIAGRLDPEIAVLAMRRGAINCLQKPFKLSLLQAVVNDAFSWTLQVRTIQEAKIHHERFNQLTPQEQSILVMAVAGCPNKQIAARMDISIKTVEKHRRLAYAKLEVENTASMVRAVTLHSMVDQNRMSIPGHHFYSGPSVPARGLNSRSE